MRPLRGIKAIEPSNVRIHEGERGAMVKTLVAAVYGCVFGAVCLVLCVSGGALCVCRVVSCCMLRWVGLLGSNNRITPGQALS